MSDTIKRGRIKPGTVVFHDMRSHTWPECCPPFSEYEGEKYEFRTKYPDQVFDVRWNGGSWFCRARGYGSLAVGEYGNGAIEVMGPDGVDLVDDDAR